MLDPLIWFALAGPASPSAREVAAIVLLDDNFRTIVGAIAEGRQLFRNLQLAFAYLLMVHIPLVLSAAIVPLSGYPLLYLPIHIVWLELLIHPTALLVFQDRPPPGRIAAVARGTRTRFYDRWSWAVILVVGGGITIATVLSYQRALGLSADAEQARAISLAVLILAAATVTAVLSGFRTRAAGVVVASAVLSTVALVQVPSLASMVHLRPLHLDDWALVVLAGVSTGALSVLFTRNSLRR
jgi:Ca2+-transporting ATPase